MTNINFNPPHLSLKGDIESMLCSLFGSTNGPKHFLLQFKALKPASCRSHLLEANFIPKAKFSGLKHEHFLDRVCV